MNIKDFFGIDIATENNNYSSNEEDKIFILNKNGELVLLEGIENDDN